MSRIVDAAWRVAVVAAAVAAGIALLALDVAMAVHVVAITAVLAAGGALADRLWICWLPFAAALVYLAGFALSGGEPGGDFTWTMATVLMLMMAFLAAAGLLAGVALRRAVAWFRQRNEGRDRAVTA